MNPGPSKIVEAIVSALVPPACRDETIGDLHEEFKSSFQWVSDALHTVPLVIVSRIRRTVDAKILLIQAFALYASFLIPAWLNSEPSLSEKWALARLAIPPAVIILGLILDDAYARPERQSPMSFARGPLLGLALAFAFQEVLRIATRNLALPRSTMFYGAAASLLLSSAIRMLFPPIQMSKRS